MMDDVRGILQEELQHVVGRLRDLGGAFMVDDGSAVLDDDDEVTEAGAGAAPVEGEREIARLERLGLAGEVRGGGPHDGEAPLPSLSLGARAAEPE